MKRVTLLVLFLAFTLNAQQKRTLTPEDVVDIRSVADASVSPDGKRIAFVVKEPGDSSKPDKARDDNIWIVPVDGREPARLFAFSAKSENTPRWSPDGRWLAFLSDRGEDGQTQIWLMRADGGEAEKLTSAKAGVDSYKWSPDGRMIAFLARDAKTDEERKKQQLRDDAIHIDHDYKYGRLWVIDLNDRKQTLITRRDMELRGFDWSPDSASFAIAFTSSPGLSDSDCHLAVVRRSDGELGKNLADNLYLLGSNVRWSPDGTTLLFFERSPRRGGYWMSLINPGGGQVRPLLKDYVGTFWACEWDSDSKHLIAEAIVGTHVKLLRLDVGSGEVTPLADIFHYGGDFSVSSDGQTLAFIHEKPDSPGDVWSLTVGQPSRQLTYFNPQIASLRLGKVRDFSWTNRKDGQALHGVLVTPADFKSGQPYPTVVQAHEGNSAWFSGWQGFWWRWAQLLASNGYVVFLPNPRGVTGQSWEFAQSIHTWSGTAFDDTMDGVDSLVEQKIADANRLGIGGWSNGGYMSTWAITHTNRFKAAVAFAAPVDFPVWWGVSDLGRFLEVTFGDTPLRARQQYEARSPLTFVQNCKTPTLIVHGESDRIVPIAESYEFYRALKALGVETEMVVYPREGHVIQERAHQIDFQNRVLAWYEKYLK
jgi:dipeptidyl aminopeptidase/acylaminoacyl peptidase